MLTLKSVIFVRMKSLIIIALLAVCVRAHLGIAIHSNSGLTPPVEQKKEKVAHSRAHVLHHTLVGRLGNQLFQYASSMGIAADNSMVACIKGGDLAMYFDGVDTECVLPSPKIRVDERKAYATHKIFRLHEDTVLEGYLQSYKYFEPNVRETILFKPAIVAEALRILAQFESRIKVGIHVRRGDKTSEPHNQLPPADYFLNVLKHFRERYANVHFVVASDDTAWCSKQTFFAADDIHIVTGTRAPAVDMAVLAGCEHMVLTVGTFGWWAAYFGADAKGGEVLYYDSEFKLEHPTNNGNVVPGDYYPEGWSEM